METEFYAYTFSGYLTQMPLHSFVVHYNGGVKSYLIAVKAWDIA